MHARGKQMEAADFERISRATAGFTGADIMNLMNQAAVITVRAVRAPPSPPPPPPGPRIPSACAASSCMHFSTCM